MACIRARKQKNGVVSYQAIVRVAGQPTLRETFTDINKARAWSDAMSTAARASLTQLPDVKAYKKITLKHALNSWEKSDLCPWTYASIIPSVLRLIGDVALAHVTQDYVLEYIRSVRQTKSQFNRPYSDVTILKHLAVLRGAVKHTAKKFNVKPELSIFSVQDIPGNWKVERKRVLKPPEEVVLREKLTTRTYGEHWALLVDLAIETAAREAELVLMELSEIDFDKRVWTIPKEHTKKKYEREVPLSRKATAVVIRLKELLLQHNTVAAQKTAGSPAQAETRLFHVFSTPSSVCTGFAQIIKGTNIKNFTFHDLRHTGITRMTLNKRKMKVEEIMAIAGHRSYSMYLKYANLRGEDLLERME